MNEKVYCSPDFSGCSALQSNKADTENNPQTVKPRVVGNTIDDLKIF